MKYFSEITKKVYDTVDQVDEAERAYREKQEQEEMKRQERAARAQEVKDAYKLVDEAREQANELLRKFCEDYGSFHWSVSNDDESGSNKADRLKRVLFDPFDLFSNL